MTAFHVGQEVVCVEDRDAFPGHPRLLKWDSPVERGRHYIIRWVGEYTSTAGRTYAGVRLSGVTRGGMRDTPLNVSRFRPIDQSKLAIFRRMCISNKPLVPVE